MLNPLWLPLPLLLAAAYFDLRSHRISDVFPLGLAACAALFAALEWTTVGWTGSVAGAVIGAAVAWLAHRFADLGSGDVLLIAGVGAVVGPRAVWVFLLLTALAGGALALYGRSRGRREIAYAPAIATGYAGVLTLLCWSAR